MDISPVRIFLVRDDTGQFTALYDREPFRGCRVDWLQSAQRFEDPRWGGKYTETGEWLEGSSPRGLDQFGVTTTADSQVLVDTAKYHPGAPHP